MGQTRAKNVMAEKWRKTEHCVDFPARPVVPDMEPAKEHVEEMHKRLVANQKEKETYLEELAEFVRVHGREVEKAKNLLKRFGVES